MKEEFIFGKGVTEDEKKQIRGHMQSEVEKWAIPLEGELSKTPEEEELVASLNSWIKIEMERIGAGELFHDGFASALIHFLPHDVFTKHFPRAVDKKATGTYTSTLGQIFLDKDGQGTRMRLLKALLHEMLHALSHSKTYADKEDEKYVPGYRTGYQVNNSMREKGDEHFRGLNEAMVDYTAVVILGNNRSAVEQFISKAPEEKTGFPLYRSYLDIVQMIIEAIAIHKQEKKTEVWERFERGLFTGNMMHLRDIEEVYGKGALQVLAVLGNVDVSADKKDEITAKVALYFRTQTVPEREALAKEILSLE